MFYYNKSPKVQKLYDYRIKYRLADGSLTYCRQSRHPNVDIYDALSHLSEVSELNVDLLKYHDLQYDNTDNFDKDAYLYARDTLKRLDDIVNHLTMERED
jgi:hypothetical protein